MTRLFLSLSGTGKRDTLSVCKRVSGVVAWIIVSFVVSFGSPASAHVTTTMGYAKAETRGSDVDLSLSLDYDLLARAIGLGRQALEAGHDVARARALESSADPISAYVAERVVLSLDGAVCEPTLRDTAVERRQDAPYALMRLAYSCPGASDGTYRLEYDVFSATDAVVDDHTTLLDYRLGGHEGRAVIDRAHPSITVGENSLAGTTVRFATMGVEHILGGFDHVLFVLALLLGARKFRDVAVVASVFTLAHSVTLAMAVLGWVDVPGWVVEPLIALSIVFVALENLLGGTGRRRLAVVFGFGLLHGLGFAGSLDINSAFSWDTVLSLISFNVGIEVGQVLLVCAVFPLLLLVRRASWSNLAYVAATSVVAGIGLVWFFDRVTFV